MKYKLFNYIDNTICQLNDGIIPEKETRKLLKVLEHKLFKETDGFEFLESINWNTFPYWKKLIFKSPEDIIKGLTKISNSGSFSTKDFVFDFLVENFLNLENSYKESFYNKNLINIKPGRQPQSNSIVCFNNKFLEHLDVEKTYHNLPGMFLLQYPHNTDFNKFEIICKDIKKVLKLNNEGFLDKFGVGIIAIIPSSYLLNNWKSFQIDTRVEFQEVFATKFFTRSKSFLVKEFFSYIETNNLPYDVKLPIKNNYLMNYAINSYISNISRNINVIPFDKNKLFNIINEEQEKIENIYKKYDMYFAQPSVFSKSIKELESITNIHARDVEVKAKVLSFILEITNIFNKKEEYSKAKKLKM